MTRDLVLGIVLLGLAVGYSVVAGTIPETQLADAVGPQGLPRAYGVLLGALSLVLIAQALRARRMHHRTSDSAKALASPSVAPATVKAVGMLALGAGYIAVVPWAGYVASLAGLIIGASAYQRGVLNRRVLLVGVCGALALWLLFVVLLGIRQPSGAWWPS